MIDPSVLKSHIDDFNEVFGRKCDRFVCPITMHECEESELINGHILNKKLNNASRRKVIQYDKVDHFYGTRVEPELVRHLNAKEMSKADIIRTFKNLQITFDDNTTAEAFVTSNAAKAAQCKYPSIDFDVEDESICVFVKVDSDDPRLGSHAELRGLMPAFPSHWAAGMLKASLLTMFDMIGYRMILDPFGGSLRITLKNYFEENATRDDAATHFRDFDNSVKLLGKGRSPSDLRTNYMPVEFDSLEDHMVLLHYAGTDQRLMFAATCLFKVNESTVTSTIPQKRSDNDVAVAWELYQKLLANDKPFDHGIYRAQFKNNQWEVETTPIPVSYVDGPDVFGEH